MNKTIIVELNQQEAIKNFLIDYSDLETDEMENNITNAKWTTKINPIHLEVGDVIQIDNASISTTGLNQDTIEIIGSATNNTNLTDNKIQVENAYYVNNNFNNNIMLPKGLAYLKNYAPNYTTQNFRNCDYINGYNKYFTPRRDAATGLNGIQSVFYSDYGAPNLEDFDNWYKNSAVSSNIINGHKLSTISTEINTNNTTTGNLLHYRPSPDRLYLGQDNFMGFYNHGYSSYRGMSLGTDYSNIFETKKTTTDIEIEKGFLNPLVLGEDITNQFLSPQQNQSDFVKPRLLNYNLNQSISSTGTYEGYFEESKKIQITSPINKVSSTTFGKVLYDNQDGKTNFSFLNFQTSLTGIPNITKPNTAKYFWNNILVGDINRATAITELYSNLYKSKNIQTLTTNLENCSFYSGDTSPDKNYGDLTPLITADPNYPQSLPFNLSENMVILKDLTSFTRTLTQEEINKNTSNFLYRSKGYSDFEKIGTNNLPKKPDTNFRVLDLQPNRVIVSNMICNKENILKLKRIQKLLEKPTKDNIKINFNNQTFKDQLCLSLELGRLDDEHTTSVYNIKNYYDATKTPITLENIDNGIIMPTCLPCPKVIADRVSITTTPNPYSYYDLNFQFPTLPLLAGLFADEDQIYNRVEIADPSVATDKQKNYTYVDEMRSNNMYEMDFYSRYNTNRTPQSGNLTLPVDNVDGDVAEFSFTDDNGEYFNDDFIKENDLGIVAVYGKLRESGVETLEFGRSAQQGNNDFSVYSVDIDNGYSVNSNNFINFGNSTNFQDIQDNSVSSGTGGTLNNTLYITQNSSNLYSESFNQIAISNNNSIALEYDAKRKIIPSSYEMLQQAFYPQGTPVQTTDTSIIGAGAGSFQATITLNATPLTNVNGAFNNIQDSWSQAFFSADNTSDKVMTFEMKYEQAFNKMLFWKLPTIDGTGFNESPKFITISASNDGSNYINLFTNVGTTGFTYSDYPDNTSKLGQPASSNLNDAKVFDLQNTTKYKYYRIVVPEVIARNPATAGFVFAASEISFTIPKQYETLLGAGVSDTQFLANYSGSSITPTSLFANSTLDRGFDNTLGNFDKSLCLKNGNSNATLLVDFGSGNQKKIEMVKIWARSDARNEMVKEMTIEGSNDNTSYTTIYTKTFDTGVAPNFIGTDYPITSGVVNQPASSHLDLANTIYMNNNANLFRYYKLSFIKNSSNTIGAFLTAEIGLYQEITPDNNKISRFPTRTIFQAKDENNNWITLSDKSITAPSPYGFVSPSTYPDNPPLTSTSPYKENFNPQLNPYQFFRWIFPSVNTINNIAIGELVLKRMNNSVVAIGNNSPSFVNNNLIYQLVKITTLEGVEYHTPVVGSFVNLHPNTTNNFIQDGKLNTFFDLTFNTTNVYDTTNNKLLLEDEDRVLDITYDFGSKISLTNIGIWNINSNDINLRNLSPKTIKIMYSSGEDADEDYKELYSKRVIQTSTPSQPSSDDVFETSPYFDELSDSFVEFRYLRISIYGNYLANNTSNRIMIGDLLISKYDSNNVKKNNVPFIGFNCMEQITKPYQIPKPAVGEFFGISPSFQNNSFSFSASFENEITYNNNEGVGDITITTGGSGYTTLPTITFTGGGLTNNNNQATGVAVISGGSLVGINITSAGIGYITAPTISISGGGGSNAQATAFLRSLRNSYNESNSIYPYFNIGANDFTFSFENSKMFMSNLHTEMKNGQSSNNMLRYFEGIQFYNDSAEEIIAPDSDAATSVVKLNRRRYEVNSQRGGFTEGVPKKIVANQVFPISNKAMSSKGLSDSISGIGITDIKIGAKDGSYISINNFNDYNYKGTLLDKLGMSNIQQLLPPYGKQNNFFNRNNHSKFLNNDNKALSIYNNCVKPFTTNSYLTPSFNQSVNVNNLGFGMESLDGNNSLEKEIPQVSDKLIFQNLPQKFAYSHLLVYSNIIPKYNWIGGSQINRLPCIGSINRSYQMNDFLFLNQNNPSYEVDLPYTLSDILIDIRMPNGLPAPLSSGSSVNLRITKTKPIPLMKNEDN